MFFDLLLIFLVFFLEINQNLLKWQIYQTLKEVKLLRDRRYYTKACSIQCDVTLVDVWIFRFMTTLNYNHQVVFFIKILKLLKI